MQFKYNYVGEETPEERLRNKLQPLFFLVDKIDQDGHCNDFPEVLKACKENMEQIRNHLSDIQPYYTGQNPIEFKQSSTNEEIEQ